MDDISWPLVAVTVAGLAAGAWVWRGGAARDRLFGPRPEGRLPDTRVGFVVAITLWFFGQLAIGAAFTGISGLGAVLLGSMVYVVTALATLRFVRGGPAPTVPPARRIAAGLVAGLAVFAVVAVVSFALTNLYERMGVEATEQAAVQLLRQLGPGERVVLVSTVVVLAPFGEEVLYRGLLLPAVATEVSPGIANVVQAGLFGFMHFSQKPEMWPFAVPLAFVGWAAGRIYLRTGSLLASGALHAAFNTIQVALLFASS